MKRKRRALDCTPRQQVLCITEPHAASVPVKGRVVAAVVVHALNDIQRIGSPAAAPRLCGCCVQNAGFIRCDSRNGCAVIGCDAVCIQKPVFTRASAARRNRTAGNNKTGVGNHRPAAGAAAVLHIALCQIAFQPLQSIVQTAVVQENMRGAGIYGVIRDTVGVERTTAELHEVALCNLAQIRLAVASIQRSAFTKVQILETDVGKAAVNLDVAVEDTVFTVAIDRQLARAGNAPDDNTGRFIGFPAPRQIDGHVIGQESVVQRLNSLAQRTEVRFCRRLNGWFYPQPGRTGIGLCYGVRDNLIRIKLFETDVAVCAPAATHVLPVYRLSRFGLTEVSSQSMLVYSVVGAVEPR